MAWTIWYPNMNILFFHLHWTTCQSTVWANGTQNSGLLNVLPESPLLFLQISSNYRKTTAKAWNWYQIWFLTNRTWICTWNILSGKNMTSFSDVSLLPEILHRNGRKNRVTITVNNQYPTLIGDSKKIARSKEKTSFYCIVNIFITINCRNVKWKLKDTSRL